MSPLFPTIHKPAGHYALTNLPWDYFNSHGIEFYGQMNFLKAGIAYADAITTVSPRYSREITTEQLGAGSTEMPFSIH